MPTNSLTIGNRDHILGRKYFKEFKLAHPEIDITWKELVEIIRESTNEIARIVTEEQTGFKLPEKLGYLVVSSFKSKAKMVDLASSKKLKKPIYHLNLHTLGNKIAIRWYGNNNYHYYHRIFKFKSCRTFARKAAKSAKSGFNFLTWSRRDFIKFDKIYKLQKGIKIRSEWER